MPFAKHSLLLRRIHCALLYIFLMVNLVLFICRSTDGNTLAFKSVFKSSILDANHWMTDATCSHANNRQFYMQHFARSEVKLLILSESIWVRSSCCSIVPIMVPINNSVARAVLPWLVWSAFKVLIMMPPRPRAASIAT